MTRRLSLMLAIAILLLVNTTMGEGGALDAIASSDGAQVAEADEAAAPANRRDTSRLAVSSSPWALSDGSSDGPAIADWGDDSPLDTTPPAQAASDTARARRSEARSAARRDRGTSEGALERHRQNIEELPPHTA